MSLYQRGKAIVEGGVNTGRLWGALKRRAANIPDVVQWYRTDEYRLAKRKQLHGMRNLYNGQRCFILGNDPSINEMDLAPLEGELTFGANRIYLMFEKLGFATTFYVAMNELVIEQCATDILRIPSVKFINWSRRHSFDEKPSDLFFLRQSFRPHFSKQLTHSIWGGATVTFAAMQLAYYFGFQKVILIGIDHSFVTQGTPHEVVTSTGADPNHFDPSYFGKGFRWQLPDLATSEYAYRLAKTVFEKDGREIIDATVDGKLNIFPKVSFGRLFSNGR